MASCEIMPEKAAEPSLEPISIPLSDGLDY
jgi:hypothetical protein